MSHLDSSLQITTSCLPPFLLISSPFFSYQMDNHNFLLFKKSYSNLALLIIFFSNFVNEILTANVNSSSCMAGSCRDHLVITYPFWIQGLQEPSCGLPGYNITCDHNTPILRISGDDYIINNIFYANKSLLLAKAEVYDDHNKCPSPRHNFSVEGTPFIYGDETADLFFFYNCTSPYAKETYSVDCATNASNHRYAFAVFHTEIPEHDNYSVCLPPVNAPVHTDSLKLLLNMTYKEILQKGFVLQWGCTNCQRKDGPDIGLKIGIGVGAAVFGAIVMCILFSMYYYRRLKKQKDCTSSMVSKDVCSYPTPVADLENAGNYCGVHVFKYNELQEATNNFDSRKELGDGGFGTVYKGKLRDGRVVAIKRLYENNYKRVEQFMNEIEILAHLHHRNLVTLYGCNSYHGRELLLVYEYIPNGTVADHLHGEHAKPGLPSWTTRLNIAVESASALAYLHASDVIHRDVKTNNILLDNNFCVKVADFGLSRSKPTNATHVSTAPQGTPGYVDPEYHQYYHLTDKSDVYSFGVVLIELISSKPAVDITRHRHEINLSNMAINKIQNDALHELVDPHLGFESNSKVRAMITAVAELAFRCLQLGREMRPSMTDILEVLQGIQRNDYNITKAEEMDIPADDVLLLKKEALASPESESVSSRSPKHNASG